MTAWRTDSRSGLATPISVAAIVVAVTAITVPSNFFSSTNIEGTLNSGAVSLPLVLGETLVLVVGGLDISVGSVMGMSGALLAGLASHGPFVAIGGALGFGALIGLLNGFLVVKLRIAAFIATLGTMTLVRGMLLTYTDQQTVIVTDPTLLRIGSGFFGTMIALAVFLAVTFVLRATTLGRHWYAIGSNSDTAFLNGIASGRRTMLAYTLSGTLAALSGVLLTARLTAASVQVGVGTELMALTAVIIGGASLRGGRGSAIGSAIGLVALVVLRNGMNLAGVATYHQIGTEALLLIAVVSLDALGTRGVRLPAAVRRRIASRAPT